MRRARRRLTPAGILPNGAAKGCCESSQMD
jgi:hypothetical protein